ncbi:MAG: DinB family protein [Janthinobacterium lividum]
MVPTPPATTAPILLPEFNAELTHTRRVLECLPEERFNWQPHPKSMTLAKLASHTVDLPGWITDTFQTTVLNLAEFAAAAPVVASSRAELLAQLARKGQAAHDTLATANDAAFAQQWTMCRGDVIIVLPQPRAAIVRHLISHMIHHRAQLMVYLRLLDVPVPGVYGPSADER